MRLSNLLPEPDTAAGLFMSRYKWLSRWAMQFTRNDTGAAEDLIQDTYLRFSQANLKVEEIRDPEALLYTYLEYVHLAHLREVARHSFTSLAEAKLDALALGLPNGPDVNRIETQNTLRRIAAYVAWRKQTSKSASIIALRFVHGYLPEEIALIARVSRSAVDERLHKGRSEVRLHLLDAQKLRTLQHGGPAQIFPSKFAVSTDELLDELHNQLFYCRRGACIPVQQLEVGYHRGPNVPLQRDQLAHIVSCQSCLTTIQQSLGRNDRPGSSGSSGGVVTMKRRGPHSDRGPLSARGMENLVRRSERRQREIFEHRPTSIIVAVNGEILASRNTGASINGLKVEVSNRDLRFVEVVNEYGVSLLSWAVELSPPHSDPVIHRAADFSQGRRLEVDLQFSAQKLVIEVQYHDPSYREIPSPSFAMLDGASNKEEEFEAVREATEFSGGRFLARKLLKGWTTRTLIPWTATAFACIALVVTLATHWSHRPAQIEAAELLQNADTFEQQALQSAQGGIVFQQVSIRSGDDLVSRSTYRDPAGKHHLKQQPLDKQMSRLKMRLAQAGIAWDAPLSAASFNEWQGHKRVRSESVQSVGGELLKLRTEIDGTDVGEETITLRAADFHPVGKTVEFRDHATIEIAELNYAVVPWDTLNRNLFESNDNRSGAGIMPLRSLPPTPRNVQLSVEELVVTELEVRTVLHDSRADSTDRLTVLRSPNGIRVRGLIEDAEVRSEVKSRLDLIPHVSSDLTSANGAPEQTEGVVAAQSVQAISVVAEPSLLEAFLLKRGVSPAVSNDIADRLFAASTSLLRANRALSQLKKQFSSDRLSPNALSLYNHLLSSWEDGLNAGLREESEAIRLTGVQTPTGDAAKAGPVDMDVSIAANRLLLKELLGHDAQNARAAPVVLADLAHSAESLCQGAKEKNENVSSTTPSDLPRKKDTQPN